MRTRRIQSLKEFCPLELKNLTIWHALKFFLQLHLAYSMFMSVYWVLFLSSRHILIPICSRTVAYYVKCLHWWSLYHITPKGYIKTEMWFLVLCQIFLCISSVFCLACAVFSSMEARNWIILFFSLLSLNSWGRQHMRNKKVYWTHNIGDSRAWCLKWLSSSMTSLLKSHHGR